MAFTSPNLSSRSCDVVTFFKNRAGWSNLSWTPTGDVVFLNGRDASALPFQLQDYDAECFVLYKHPLMQQLIVESEDFFVDIADISNSKQGDNIDIALLQQYCMSYQALIERQRKCIPPNAPGFDRQLLKRFQVYEAVFLLLCHLYLRTDPNAAASDLLPWSDVLVDNPETIATALLEAADAWSEEKEEFTWRIAHTCVLLGKIDAAVGLLGTHPNFLTVEFSTIISLLNVFKERLLELACGRNAYSRHSEADDEKFITWRQMITDRMAEGQLSNEPELELMAQLMRGDNVAYIKVGSMCDTWLCLLIGRIIHSTYIPISQLAKLGQRCVDLYDANRLSSLDQVYRSLLNMDMRELVLTLRDIFTDHWLAVQVANILYCVSPENFQLQPLFSNPASTDLRQTITINFAQRLLCMRSYWSCGVTYMLPFESARQALEVQLVALASLSSDWREKVLHECFKKNLVDIRQKILTERALYCCHRGEYEEALGSAVTSKHLPTLRHVCEVMLRNNPLSLMSRLPDQVDWPVAPSGDFISILAQFHECHGYLKTGNCQRAINCLKRLIANGKLEPTQRIGMCSKLCSMLSQTKIALAKEDALELLGQFQLLRVHKDDASADHCATIATVLLNQLADANCRPT